MIRFACPVCHAVLSVDGNRAGRKAPCPKCGQRLQIPSSPQKTVLGKPLPTQDEPAVKLPDWMDQPPPIRSGQPAMRPPERQPEPLDCIEEVRPPPSRRRSGSWLLFVLLGATIPVVLLVACCSGVFVLFALPSLAPNNAKCPVCGAEFHVPDNCPMELDDHSYRCPSCGRVMEGSTFRIVGHNLIKKAASP
jgi:Zn finger protein HypA/HybF involved in hydrogenase expression